MICYKAAQRLWDLLGKFLKVVEKSQNSTVRKGFGIFIITFKTYHYFRKYYLFLCSTLPTNFSNSDIAPPHPIILHTPGSGWVYCVSSKECNSSAVIQQKIQGHINNFQVDFWIDYISTKAGKKILHGAHDLWNS